MQTHSVELLDELVRANLDVETAFTVCACVTSNDRLGIMLLARARLCGEAARCLSATGGVSQYKRADIVSKRSTPDWVALHEAMLAHDDARVREECARAEDEVLMHFRDALEYELPWEVQRVVEKHFAALLEDYGSLRVLTLPAPAKEPRRPPLRVVRQARITGHA